MIIRFVQGPDLFVDLSDYSDDDLLAVQSMYNSLSRFTDLRLPGISKREDELTALRGAIKGEAVAALLFYESEMSAMNSAAERLAAKSATPGTTLTPTAAPLEPIGALRSATAREASE